jgi:CRISPR/Cas system-associated protein Cas10 (large subunit of type III CRISPR-Cas system)
MRRSVSLLIATFCFSMTIVESSTHDKVGRFVPPELRRTKVLGQLAARRDDIEEELETSSDYERPKLVRELTRVLDEIESHREGIAADAKEHHSIRQERAKLIEATHADDTDKQAKLVLTERIRELEEKHQEIRLRALGMNESMIRKHHETRNQIRRVKAEMDSADISERERTRLGLELGELQYKLRRSVEATMRRHHNSGSGRREL